MNPISRQIADQNEKFSLSDIVLFSIFLFSLLLIENKQGVSVSYLFLLLFLIPIRRVILSRQPLGYILFFFLIFIAGLPHLLFNGTYYFTRTTLSFIAFICPFLLLLIQFKERDLDLFVYAVIISSVFYSLISIASYFSNLSIADIGKLKSIIGSQRYGFVLCFGFFLVLFDKKSIIFLKVFALVVIFLGMILTFSRATIIASVFAFVLFLFMSIPGRISTKVVLNKTIIIRVFSFSVLAFIALYFLSPYIKMVWSYFESRLITQFFSGHMINSAESLNTHSSEGYRLYVMKQIFHYLLANPLTGSNYAGLYLLFDEYSKGASTHNQYSDILLRTGLLGFGLYLYLLYKLLRFFRNNKGVLYGLVSILIYGLFHETFKLGYGAFIFGFLLSYSYWINRRQSLTLDQTINLK